MLKNVKKSHKMSKKKNLTTFDQNEYDIRDQWPITHKTYYPVGKFHGPKSAHETVTSVWSISTVLT